MNQSKALLESAKQRMRERGLHYVDIARRLGLSESSVKRLFAKGDISLKRLEQLCGFLEVTLLELARAAEHPPQQHPRELSEMQEQALADDPRALNYFYKLLQDWTPERMETEFGIKPLLTTEILQQLEALKLIEREPGLKVKLKVDSRLNWRRHGPLWKRYHQLVQRHFFNDPFEHVEAHLTFDAAELSLQARGELAARLRQLELDFNQLAEHSRDAPEEERQSVGLILAIRPWKFRQIMDLDPTTAFKI